MLAADESFACSPRWATPEVVWRYADGVISHFPGLV